MTSLDIAKKYLGKMWIGTNTGDKGQCVGLFNQVNLEFLGVNYPIQGAGTAFQILSARNTRPDLVEQVKNKSFNPNFLPSIGDWVIWNKNWGGGAGHISCVESLSVTGFTGIEQNFVADTVTRQQHSWTNVVGWVHYISNQKGDDVNTGDVTNMYRVLLGREPDVGGLKTFVGKSFSVVFYALIGSKEYADRQASLVKSVEDLRVALANEKNKPPVKVIETVEKIVDRIVVQEKIVEVEPSWVKKVRDFILGFLNKKG